MLRPLGRLAFALCAWQLVACGEPAAESPLGGVAGAALTAGASGAGMLAPGGGGAASGGMSSGGSAGQSAAGTSSGGAMACSAYMDQAGYTLPVHIKNTSSVTLYLGQPDSNCQVERLFQVEDGARHVLPSLDDCHTSCQQLMQTGPVACPLACAAPSTITLGPGQGVDVPWDGRFAVPQTLPTNCMPSAATGSGACVQAQQIEASVFTFSARAGTQRQCLTGTCNCVANANGTCTSASSTISGTIITTEYLVKLEPGETSTTGAPPYIALEFKDIAK